MNKKELCQAVAAAVEANSGRIVPQTTVALVIDELVAAIAGALVAGDSVALRGLGTFSTAESKARTGRNPKTGEPLEIPAKTKVKFRSGIKLEA